MRREKALEEQDRIDRRALGHRLRQMCESDQHEEDERHRRQQRIERQGAGQERDVVFVSGLKSTGKKTGGRAIPPAGS